MPFPLAHPAAILPLKKKWPRSLNLAALVIGSICPDSGYLWSRYHMDDYSHSLQGAFIFCLPVGLAMLAVFYFTRRLLAGLLPPRQRAPFVELCNQPVGPFWSILLSLVLGIATHLAWDSFTHRNGFMHNVELLHHPLLRYGYRTLTLGQILRYVSSFLGVAFLCYYFERWWHGAHPEARTFKKKSARIDSVIAGSLVIPMQGLNDFMATGIGHLLVIGCIFLLVAGVVLNMGFQLRERPAEPAARIREADEAVGKG